MNWILWACAQGLANAEQQGEKIIWNIFSSFSNSSCPVVIFFFCATRRTDTWVSELFLWLESSFQKKLQAVVQFERIMGEVDNSHYLFLYIPRRWRCPAFLLKYLESSLALDKIWLFSCRAISSSLSHLLWHLYGNLRVVQRFDRVLDRAGKANLHKSEIFQSIVVFFNDSLCYVSIDQKTKSWLENAPCCHVHLRWRKSVFQTVSNYRQWFAHRPSD